MRVLVVGSGGREHAIAWACEQHGHTVSITPGLGDVTAADVDLVIPGPESALVAGIADECSFRKIPCLGPISKQARIESSKGYSRHLATSLGVPGPSYERFEENGDADALAWWREFGKPVVVKLDGLAAGKGVIVPADDAATEAAIRSTALLGPFVLEERLTGPECSLLALCDGITAVALPLAQDHKRIGEGDTGPNTGGMGAFAPAPVAYDADAADAHVRAADRRLLRLGRHTVCRRVVRRTDADRRRPASDRVQLPIRGSGDAGRVATARERPGRARPGLHVRDHQGSHGQSP